MENKYIIITGRCKPTSVGYKDTWDEPTYLKHYFNSKENAEMFLVNEGYEKDDDDVYFRPMDGVDVIAKIIRLSNIF